MRKIEAGDAVVVLRDVRRVAEWRRSSIAGRGVTGAPEASSGARPEPVVAAYASAGGAGVVEDLFQPQGGVKSAWFAKVRMVPSGGIKTFRITSIAPLEEVDPRRPTRRERSRAARRRS